MTKSYKVVGIGNAIIDILTYVDDEFLKKNNIKSIIIDHHEINKPYPEANVIINPKKK